MRSRMSAFELYLRTGRRDSGEPELVQTKFNPWHDPENGRFTFAGRGRHFGSGPVGSGEATAGRRRVTSGPRARASIVPAQAPNPARPGPNQDSATFLRNPKEALERIRRETSAARNTPATNYLVQKFKRHMTPKEGNRNDVYPDSRRIPTVGIGHKVVPADKLKIGDQISNARKEAFWRQDSAAALQAAQQQTKEAGIRDTDFLVALADVNFQLGRGWRTEFKKTWALILVGDYDAAAREVKDSKWFKQTPSRVLSFRKALLVLSRKRTPKGR